MRQKTIEMKDSFQSTNAGLLILGVHHKVKKNKGTDLQFTPNSS